MEAGSPRAKGLLGRLSFDEIKKLLAYDEDDTHIPVVLSSPFINILQNEATHES